MTKISLYLLLATAILPGPSALSAQEPAGAQRLVVPLSSPGQPVVLSASLVQGSITVQAYEGSEVIVETRTLESKRKGRDRDCEGCEHDNDGDSDDGGGDSRASGLRLIPNVSIGLTVEESNNRVQVSSESWNRRVEIVIQVPRRTSLKLETVNGGDLRVSGASGDHELQNTNGAISAIDVRGSVIANTTNGDVEVRLLDVTPGKAMSFASLNGDVDVTLPPGVSATFLLNPGMGDIYTDFDVRLESVAPEIKTSPRRQGYRVEMKQEVKGTVGAPGGPEIHLRSFNGSIFLRRLKP